MVRFLSAGRLDYAYTNGNPISETDPLGTDPLGMGGPIGRSLAMRAAMGQSCPRLSELPLRRPDFLVIQLDAYVFSASATFTEYGDVFVGGGFARQYNDPRNVGVAIADGWMLSATPPESGELNNFLVGYAAGVSAYGPFGGGFVRNSTGKAILLGVGRGTIGNTFGGFSPGSGNVYMGNIFGQ